MSWTVSKPHKRHFETVAFGLIPAVGPRPAISCQHRDGMAVTGFVATGVNCGGADVDGIPDLDPRDVTVIGTFSRSFSSTAEGSTVRRRCPPSRPSS